MRTGLIFWCWTLAPVLWALGAGINVPTKGTAAFAITDRCQFASYLIFLAFHPKLTLILQRC